MRGVTAFIIVVAFLHSGCSVFEPVPARSLPIVKAGMPEQVSELRKSPYVYLLTFPDRPIPDLYLTVLEECNLAETLSGNATTRQLFIGLKQLSIENQKRLKVGDRTIFRSVARARLEEVPLTVVSYSLRDKDCVRDYVSWFPWETTQPLLEDMLSPLDTMLEDYLSHSDGLPI